eukprot:433137-Hanusia_phi.AAC.1
MLLQPRDHRLYAPPVHHPLAVLLALTGQPRDHRLYAPPVHDPRAVLLPFAGKIRQGPASLLLYPL